MSFWEGIIGTVVDNAPSIIGGIGDIIGNDQVTDGNDAAADAIGEGYAEADAIYQGAYDEALGYQLDALGLDSEVEADRLQSILPFIASLRDDYTTGARVSGINYGDVVQQAGLDYANAVMGGGLNFAGAITAGGDDFADTMRGASDEFDRRIAGGAQRFHDETTRGARAYDDAIEGGFRRADRMFQPYSEEGLHALDLLRTITARDPSELDPSQRRMRERSIRDMRANLAASGLRGAGRAGVASVNEGIADLDANMFDSNRARVDRAIDTLSGLGFNASGQRAGLATGAATRTGDNRRRAADAIARNDMTTAELGARTRMAADDLSARMGYDARTRGASRMWDARSDAADRMWRASTDAAGRSLNVEDAILQNDARRGDQALDLLNNFYTGRTSRGVGEADARTWATMGQADSAATAAAGSRFAEGQALTANARSNANTTGSITSMLSNLFSGTGRRDTSAPSFAPAT